MFSDYLAQPTVVFRVSPDYIDLMSSILLSFRIGHVLPTVTIYADIEEILQGCISFVRQNGKNVAKAPQTP